MAIYQKGKNLFVLPRIKGNDYWIEIFPNLDIYEISREPAEPVTDLRRKGFIRTCESDLANAIQDIGYTPAMFFEHLSEIIRGFYY